MFPLVVINDGFFFLVGLEFSYIASCTRGFSSNGCTNFLPHYCDDDRDDNDYDARCQRLFLLRVCSYAYFL